MVSGILDQLIQNSEETINWILSRDAVTDTDQLLLFAHSISYHYRKALFPYYADEKFKCRSIFLETWLKRLSRRHRIVPDSLTLTSHAKKHLKLKNPIGTNPIISPVNVVFPYSSLPPSTINFPDKSIKIRVELGELEIILTGLLPIDPAYFFIFSHFDKQAMRTTYPLIKDGNEYLGVYMGDIRNIVLVPEIDVLDSCYNSYCDYLREHINDNFKQYVEVVIYLFSSLSSMQFIHSCKHQTALLNKQENTVDKMLDFVPKCQGCGMKNNEHLNIIEMRHSLGRAWEKGVLSELFFSKLVVDAAQRIDKSIEVYPRLLMDGIPHECDVFVKRRNKIILFELKRSTAFDGYCQKAVTQLTENKSALELLGAECTTVLVSNMVTRNLPDGVNIDAHLIADDLYSLDVKLQNLLS